MPNTVIIAPIPEFSWGPEHSAQLSANICIGPLLPGLRRKMLNAAKQQDASQDVIRVTLESDHVIVGTVPADEPRIGMVCAALYTYVGDLALKRFVDLLRLSNDVPDCFDRSCWYTADGDPREVSTPISLGYPHWTCPPAYASGLHPGMGFGFFVHDDWRSRCAALLGMGELEGVFATFWNDPAVVQEAHALCMKRIHGFLRKQFSEELGVPPEQLEIDWPEADKEPGSGHMNTQTSRAIVPAEYAKDDAQDTRVRDMTSLYFGWFGEAFAAIYRERLKDAERERYVTPARSRFQRAYQAFTNSFRMDDPFRYVARATCLEALLGVDHAELTHQLASRAAWLIEPSNVETRYATYQEVKRCYDLRSKIVHGDTYKPKDFNDCGEKLLALVRILLVQIIFDDRLHKLFFEAGANQCREFLRKLSIGCVDSEEPGPAE